MITHALLLLNNNSYLVIHKFKNYYILKYPRNARVRILVMIKLLNSYNRVGSYQKLLIILIN